MTKTTKIILLSTGGLVLGIGAFLGVRYIIKRRKEKRQQDQAKLMANMPTTTATPKPPINPSKPTTSATTTTQVPSTSTGTAPSSTQVITSSGVPVVMTSYSSAQTKPIDLGYNPNSSSFQRLDKKLKSLYYILAPLDKKEGKLIYVETNDFKPEKPNTEVRDVMQQTFYKQGYDGFMDVLRGFNTEEKDAQTKGYGNLLLDVFKKQRLDYLFPSKTADGKDTMFSPNAQWFKEADRKSIEKNLKTDFWKTN